MNAIQIIAIIMMMGGVLSLMYGSFNYTSQTPEAKLGSLELTAKDTQTIHLRIILLLLVIVVVKATQTVYIPIWASIGTIVSDSGFLLFASRKN